MIFLVMNPELHSHFILESLGRATEGHVRIPIQQFSTDSRRPNPQGAFVAIQGETLDGHDFIPQAIAQGARVVIHNEHWKKLPPAASDAPPVLYIAVPDTLAAFRSIARQWRMQFSIPVIAIAGSVGKTTTKELLYCALQGKWTHVLKTEGSQNGFLGVALTLIQLRSHHCAAVIEIGIDEIGAMEQHLEVVRPNYALVTAIGPEHLEKLLDLDTVTREEALALEWTSKQGQKVFLNLDEPWLEPYQKRLPRAVTYSLTYPSSDYCGSTQDHALNVIHLEMKQARFQLPLPGIHHARNTLAAIAVAHTLGLSPEQIQRGLATFKPGFGRTEIFELKNGITILADYYNANPTSVLAALHTLNQLSIEKKTKRKWLCLGDMLELGADEQRYHRELADPIRTGSIAGVFLYGERMALLADELIKKKFAGSIHQCQTHQEIADFLVDHAQPGDLVLIKGSRGKKMETLWQILQNKGWFQK